MIGGLVFPTLFKRFDFDLFKNNLDCVEQCANHKKYLYLGILLVSNLTFSAPLGFVIGFDVIPPPEGETFAL